MKSKEQLQYEKELEDYKFKLQIWYAKWNEANSCSLQWSDGRGNPDSLKCGMSGRTCTRCKMYNFSEPKPRTPKFKYFIKSIPKYCEDCIYKKNVKIFNLVLNGVKRKLSSKMLDFLFNLCYNKLNEKEG